MDNVVYFGVTSSLLITLVLTIALIVFVIRRKPENPKDRWPKKTTKSIQYHYDQQELKESIAKWRKEFGLDKKK
jgi:ABC-type dipeptide/oligopeptide/nickel transport system permease component